MKCKFTSLETRNISGGGKEVERLSDLAAAPGSQRDRYRPDAVSLTRTGTLVTLQNQLVFAAIDELASVPVNSTNANVPGLI